MFLKWQVMTLWKFANMFVTSAKSVYVKEDCRMPLFAGHPAVICRNKINCNV